MAQQSMISVSIEDLATFENLINRQQLYLWQIAEVECDIQCYILELKARINYENIDDGGQLDEKKMFSDEIAIQNRILNFLGKTESQVTIRNMSIHEFIDNQMELCNKIDDMKMLIQKFHENFQDNKTEYFHINEEIAFIDAIDIKDMTMETDENQLNQNNIANSGECTDGVSAPNKSDKLGSDGLSKVIKTKGTTMCCTICRKVFHNLPERKLHMRMCYPDLQCPICNHKVNRRSKFGEHLRACQARESAGGNFICSICKQGFADVYLRAVHLRKVHKLLKAYPCNYCDSTYSSRYGLNEHLPQHTGERPFICDICSESFSRRKAIIRHMMKHSTYPYLCSICGIGKETSTILALHMQMHIGEKRFKCPECDKNFMVKYAMLQHVKRIHQGIVQKFPCTQCDREFLTNCGLQEHLLRKHSTAEKPTDKPHKCSICHRGFYRKSQLKGHNKQMHGPREFTECAVCNKGFRSRQGLRAHLLTHTSERNVECNECSSKFYTVLKLKAHIRNVHRNSNVTYKCETCNAVSKSLSSYIQHKYTHTKPYECHICKKTFGQLNTLNVHLLKHSGEKPHICDFCNKGFTQPSDLKTHRRIHTGEKPFSCSHCHRKFTDNRNMKKHMKVHAPK